MTDLKALLSELAEAPTSDCVGSQLVRLAKIVEEIEARHVSELQRLAARIEQLELGLVYADRGCGA